jgi:peptidoglycan hydrolase-like protein with peptidoglycan-binding domain
MIALLAIGTGAVLVALKSGALRGGQPTSAAPALATASVVRTTLATTVAVDGVLGFGEPRTIISQNGGTAFTALPAVGRELRRGQVLYRVDGRPVVLLYGSTPAWRPLRSGVTAGPDVRALERNLRALGAADGVDLTVDDTFTYATTLAIKRWQRALGVTVTGEVVPGDIVYARTRLRVSAVTAILGAPATPGTPVVVVTSTTPQIAASLPVAEQFHVRRGDRVTVTLPGSDVATDGVVASIARVATVPAEPDPGQGGGPPSIAPTLPMTVVLDHPSAQASFDQAPVTVDILGTEHRDVLAVPVNALLALAGGGYAVEVVSGAASRLVPVATGLFADTLVEVSGAGLGPGVKVAVPAS